MGDWKRRCLGGKGKSILLSRLIREFWLFFFKYFLNFLVRFFFDMREYCCCFFRGGENMKRCDFILVTGCFDSYRGET